jgi:hypothetical protein
MNRSTISSAVLLPILLMACKRQQLVNSEPTGNEGSARIELTPEEVVKLTEALFVGVDENANVLQSEAYLSMMKLHGPAFKRELIKRIEQADSVAITEETFWTDFIPRNSISRGDAPQTEKDAPKYDYRSVILIDAQKRAFLQAAKTMDGTTEGDSLFCGFQPHHRMEFIQHNKVLSTLEICFQCNQIHWDEKGLRLPKGLFQVLGRVVEDAGLATKRDWSRLAIERREQAVAPNRSLPSSGD